MKGIESKKGTMKPRICKDCGEEESRERRFPKTARVCIRCRNSKYRQSHKQWVQNNRGRANESVRNSRIRRKETEAIAMELHTWIDSEEGREWRREHGVSERH